MYYGINYDIPKERSFQNENVINFYKKKKKKKSKYCLLKIAVQHLDPHTSEFRALRAVGVFGTAGGGVIEQRSGR